jgi:hypothetical protein
VTSRREESDMMRAAQGSVVGAFLRYRLEPSDVSS